MKIRIARGLAALLPAAALFCAGCSSAGRANVSPVPGLAPALVSAPAAGRPAGRSKDPKKSLFVIERSLNSNVVHYDAQLDPDGRLDPKEPVIGYWVMLAEQGQIAQLNWIEQLRAYGFTTELNPSGNTYKMTLSSAPGRPMLIKNVGEDVRAEGLINGRPAIIERIYVKLSEGVLGPKVKTIEVHGTSLLTGEHSREIIEPD